MKAIKMNHYLENDSWSQAAFDAITHCNIWYWIDDRSFMLKDEDKNEPEFS